MHKVLASIVRFFHFAWLTILLVLIGLCVVLSIGLPGSKLCKLAWIIYAAYLIIMFGGEAVLGGCPLRIVEESLRRYDDPTFSYKGSFIAYHIGKIFKVNPPRAAVITLFSIVVGTISLAIFVGIILI